MVISSSMLGRRLSTMLVWVCKNIVFKRTKTAVEKNIFATFRRYAKKLKSEYNGDVYLERDQYKFDI